MNNFSFVLLLLPIIIFSILADKTNKKVFLYIAIILVSLLVGLRGINVGIDTKPYYNAIINNFPVRWQFEEIGFRYISEFLMGIFKNAIIVVLIYSSVTNSLIFLRLWDFRKKCSFSVMILLYLLIYLFYPMNIMRQFMAISIILYSTKLLEKKKYIIFLLIIFASSLIHKTALLSLAFVLIYCWNSLSKNKKILFLVPTILISVVSLTYIIKYENDHITNYFSSSNSISNLNLTFIYRFMIFIFSYILYKSNKKVIFNKNKRTKNEIEFHNDDNNLDFKNICFIYFIGLLFSSSGMFFEYMTRIGLYYLCYEIIYWGYLAKSSKNKYLNFMLISIYAVYVFSFELIYNGSGIFPYYFVV